MTAFWFAASHEQFPPGELLEQAAAAEAAGFDGVGCSDHFAPWWPGGESGQAWAWLGAAGQVVKRVPVGTGVTAPVHRYHPAIVAQAFMTLEAMYPGRVFLGVGSGEALNEMPCGMDWPSPDEQVERLEQALETICALWAGETVSHDRGWYRTRAARLYTRAATRPKLYVSAFGPKAAGVAARWGDGVWTLGDPEQAPQVVEAYRAACDDAGREPGEVILHTGFGWARDADALMDSARGWRGAQPPEVYTDAIGTPEAIQDVAAPQVSDEDLAQGFLISADPDEHVERIRRMEELGATVVCLQNVSGADPLGTVALYGDHVLPALRGARV